MLHKMGFDYTCPECGRPCKSEDVNESGDACKGCDGPAEARVPAPTMFLSDFSSALKTRGTDT